MIVTSKKFQNVFQSIIKKLNYPSRIAIALSGGVDSMCLTHLLNQYYYGSNQNQNNFNETKIIAITIDHKLRNESSIEALNIHKYIAQKFPKVTHIIGEINIDVKNNHKNFESLARTKRYLKLKEICEDQKVSSLFIGHNLDDSIETYMLRKNKVRTTRFHDSNMENLYKANKIYGLGSLKSISDLQIHENTPYYFLSLGSKYNYIEIPRIKLVRPLLDFYKTDLYNTCKYHGIQWVEDQTNFDPTITERNKIRHNLSRNVNEKKRIHFILSKTDELLETDYNITEIDQYFNCFFSLELSAASIYCKCQEFIKLNPVVINRWLFEKLEIISSAEKYHYKFLRIYNLSYKIHEFIIKNRFRKLNLSYLNMSFEITRDDDKLFINISRQTPVADIVDSKMKIVINCKAGKFTDWKNYDNRFLFRFKTRKDTDLLLHPFHVDMRTKLSQILNIMSEKKVFMKKLCKIIKDYHIPVLSDLNSGKIIGIPSLGIMDRSIQYEWGK